MNARLLHRPSLERPYWRDESGRRTTVLALVAGRGAAERERLLVEHCDAVCRIIRSAAAARVAGDDRRARMLANRASRLCGELAGLWPQGSDEPLR
jgi:hypothetical protein